MKKLLVLTASRLFPGRSPMKITRRFAVASLLVIAVAVVLGTPAPASAAKRARVTYVKLYPAADSPFPRATGTVTLYPAGAPYFLPYGVGVSVSRLAPNALYYMPGTFRWRDYYGVTHDEDYNVSIQTDAWGNGEGWFGRSDFLIMYYSCQVYDSSGTLVLTWSR